MKKEKIKNWVKAHKRGLMLVGIGGATVLAIHGHGVRAGKKQILERMDKCLRTLGKNTFICIEDKYLVKDLGQVGLDSLKAVGCPSGVNENSKVNAIFYFYDEN